MQICPVTTQLAQLAQSRFVLGVVARVGVALAALRGILWGAVDDGSASSVAAASVDGGLEDDQREDRTANRPEPSAHLDH